MTALWGLQSAIQFKHGCWLIACYPNSSQLLDSKTKDSSLIPNGQAVIKTYSLIIECIYKLQQKGKQTSLI